VRQGAHLNLVVRRVVFTRNQTLDLIFWCFIKVGFFPSIAMPMR
jgi:hypothetical protein